MGGFGCTRAKFPQHSVLYLRVLSECGAAYAGLVCVCVLCRQEYFELVVSEFVYLPWKDTQRLLGHQAVAAAPRKKKLKLVAPRDSDDDEEDEGAEAMEEEEEEQPPTPAVAALTPAAPLNAQVGDMRGPEREGRVASESHR